MSYAQALLCVEIGFMQNALNPIDPVNPLLSMWMSTINQSMGAARGLAIAELQRQSMAMQVELGKQIVDFWVGAWTSAVNQTAGAALQAAKGKTKAELQPKSTAMQADLGRQIINFWTGAWMRLPSQDAT